MSGHGSLLPIPDPARLEQLRADWPDPVRWPFRSRWLHEVETWLRGYYPFASSRDLSLTARGAAPFPLLDGPNVP